MTTPKLDNNIFGIRLRDLRKQANLSMAELVDKLNRRFGSSISVSAVSMWESGQREPMASTIKMLSDFFSVSPAFLMGMSDDPAITEDPVPSVARDEYIESLTDAFRKLSIPGRATLLAYAWDLLDKEGKA